MRSTKTTSFMTESEELIIRVIRENGKLSHIEVNTTDDLHEHDQFLDVAECLEKAAQFIRAKEKDGNNGD